MKKIPAFCLLLLPFFSSAQNSLVQSWDYRYGGYLFDLPSSFLRTQDGSFLLGGYSTSDSSADILQHTRDTAIIDMNGVLHGDFWIVKTDSSGIMQWNKRYGGDKGDYLYSAIQIPGGGYLLGGSSLSGISGDRTEANWNPTTNISTDCEDYWIVKTDASGNKLWDKRYGGNKGDRCTSIIRTSANDYMLAGYSYSPVSGDKTMPQVNNSTDFWIVKINSAGVKIWDKVIGGAQIEEGPIVIKECADGGFAIGGLSYSGIGGDKTDSLRDTLTTSTLFRGDYWLVKIDSSGNKLWDKTFGGASVDWFSDLIITSDGGFLLGGYTWSMQGGDVSEASRDTSMTWWNQGDYWIVKTDSAGNKEWDKRFGGQNQDFFNSVSQTPDGGFLLAGRAFSGIGGDKTEISTGYDTWLVKTDALGNKLWDKTIYNMASYGEHAFMNADGCVIISTGIACGISGDVSQANRDSSGLNQNYDYWITKFCDSIMVSIGNEIRNDGLKIFPNPAKNKLTVDNIHYTINSISIINLLGEKIENLQPGRKNQKAEVTLDVSMLKPGIYILQVSGDNKNIFAKFIKE